MDLSRPVSEFFSHKAMIYRFLVFSVIFAFLFIFILFPYKSDALELEKFIYTAILSLSGVAIIAASRFIIRARGRKHTVTYGILLAWTLFVELIPLTVVYTVATCIMCDAIWQEVIFKIFIYITLLLLLLYALFVFSVLLRQKSKELKEMRDSSVIRDDRAKSNVPLPFYDEKGELKVTIHKSNLLYIESADNYVYLWYINKETVSRLLIRNTLKTLEYQLAKTNIMRCHRSYMINLDHVSMIRKEKGNLYAVFDVSDVVDIPVSGSYYDRVLKSFIQH